MSQCRSDNFKPDWISSLPADQQEEANFDYNERAAILEYDGCLPRALAELQASEQVRKRYTVIP